MSPIDWASVGIIITILSAVASLTWWLSLQFASVKVSVHEKIDEVEERILGKLEYHEKHDDQRFNAVTNELWEMKLRNAAVRGVINSAKGQLTPIVRDLQDHFKGED